MKSRPHTVITGLGLWTTGFPNAQAWLMGAADPAVVAATGESLDKRSRRRASSLTRALSDVVAEAAAQSGADLSTVPAVFGSALGEAETMIGLLDQMWRTGEPLSPTGFAMSVHNAAAGLISIAAGNRGFTTSLAADYDTPAMALMEAAGVVASGPGPVIVVCGDEASPQDLVPAPERFALLAVAVVLARPEDAGERALATLSGPFSATTPATAAPAVLDEALARNPQAGLFDLVDAVLRRRFGTLRLDRGQGAGWLVELGPSPSR